MEYQLTLKEDTPDHVYTRMCNLMKKQGVFAACGNCDDKWIIGKWEDELDFFAWCIAEGFKCNIVIKETG